MKLADLKMDELRALGFDLEATLDREVPGANKKKDLVATLEEALLELAGMGDSGEGARSASDLLRSKGVDDDPLLLPELPVFADEAEAAEFSPDPVTDEGEDDEIEEPEKDAPAAVEGSKHDYNPPLATPPPYALQVREHPSNGVLSYGDLILNPTKEDVCLVHIALNQKGYEKLQRAGYRTHQR